MQFLKNTTTLSLIYALCAFATASPVEKRNDAQVNMFAGDLCDGAENGFSVEGSGSYRCVPVSGSVRSILVTGGGCDTVTWSGTNCAGSAFNVPDSGCHSVLYGSVSVSC